MDFPVIMIFVDDAADEQDEIYNNNVLSSKSENCIDDDECRAEIRGAGLSRFVGSN